MLYGREGGGGYIKFDLEKNTFADLCEDVNDYTTKLMQAIYNTYWSKIFVQVFLILCFSLNIFI